ncbi:putative reverse transcriptase domain-containing protein [Tanacetum coccineum]
MPKRPMTFFSFYANVTCFGCGEKGHFKDKCPKAGNLQNDRARGRAYVVVENPQQNPNVVTDTFLLNDHYASQLNNLGREIKKVNEKFYAAQVGCDQCKGPHYTKDCPQKEEEKTLEEAYYTQFGRPFQRGDIAKLLQGASVSVMPLSTYLNLGLGELVHTRVTVELANRIVKYPNGIAENVLVGIGKFTFLVYFIILDMPEDIRVPLILGIPFFSTARAKIDLRRNQGDDLMPTIEEGEVFEKFRIRNEDLDTGIDDYPSYCDDDNKIHINCANNLKSLNECAYLCWNFFCDDRFCSFRKYGCLSDEGMGDVIFGEPFLREADIKAKRFEGMITLYKGDDEVTYQMVRSHPRFKHHTNEQCNKIPPLLKVNEKDVMNGVLHAYQKLKGFYKGVLNLGSDYIVMRRQKNGSHAGTSACMHWIKKEAEKKSNLKTSL